MTRLRTRHVKCDESQPRCQRCTSTGRICDEYGRSSTLPSPPSGVVIADSIASGPRSISPAEDVQELRSFEFFRSQVAPDIGGFFGSSTWNLVLQACTSEPAVNQAVVALGALYERLSLSLRPSNVGDARLIETDFPLQQYAKALSGFRRYLSMTKDLNLDTVLACALIHISIEVIRNNYVNAIVHLESSLQLLQHSSTEAPSPAPGQSNRKALLKTAKVDSDLARAFLRLDLQASTYRGMRAPAVAGKHAEDVMPARFYSISQAKDVLDSLTGQLYSLIRTTIEDYRYRKDRDIPVDAVAQVAHVKDSLDIWNERFEKYLDRPTSRFSRQEQLAINILLISHRVSTIEAATCAHPEETIFDQFDAEFDEIVTLAAVIIRARNTVNPRTLDFSLDMGVIYPVYWTAVKCRELWTRQRAMALLRSITFQEGVWNAAAQASIAEVAIAREQQCSTDESSAGKRPLEFARVHSVGTNILDPVKRVAEVNLTQRLDGLDGPWHNHVEWVTW
jgi:hypothetical protein